MVSLRIGDDLLKQIDRRAQDVGNPRAATIRALLWQALRDVSESVPAAVRAR